MAALGVFAVVFVVTSIVGHVATINWMERHDGDSLYRHYGYDRGYAFEISPCRPRTCNVCRRRWQRSGILLPHRKWHEGRW